MDIEYYRTIVLQGLNFYFPRQGHWCEKWMNKGSQNLVIIARHRGTQLPRIGNFVSGWCFLTVLGKNLKQVHVCKVQAEILDWTFRFALILNCSFSWAKWTVYYVWEIRSTYHVVSIMVAKGKRVHWKTLISCAQYEIISHRNRRYLT